MTRAFSPGVPPLAALAAQYVVDGLRGAFGI